MSKNVLDTVPDTKALIVNKMDKIFALIELPFFFKKRGGGKDSKHVNRIDNKVMYYKEKIKQGRMGVVVVVRVLLFSTRLVRKGISEEVTLESLRSVWLTNIQTPN